MITAYQELRAILIGKFYTSDDLAFYKKGAQFPDLLTTNINSSISAVLFPRFSQIQNDLVKVKQAAKNAIRYSFFIIAPLLFGLAAVAENFVSVFLTDKWLACVPYIWLFCLNSLFFTLHSTNMQLLKVLGQVKTFMRLEFIKKAIELIMLLTVFRFGVIWIAAAMAITSTLFTYLNCIPTKKSIGYAFKEQIKDIASPLGMCIIMFVAAFLIGKLPLGKGLLLVMQVTVGMLVYFGLSYLTRNKEFFEILSILKGTLQTKISQREDVQ